VKSPVGVWSVVGSDEGVIHIHLPQDELPASKGEPPKPSPTRWNNSRSLFGLRRTFKVQLALAATDFQHDVWEHCERSLRQVRTYGEVANAVNRPRAHRAVGTRITQPVADRRTLPSSGLSR